MRAELLAALRRNPNSTRGILEVHMEPPPVQLLRDSECIFTARDPVDRIVSAFNWRLPAGGGAWNHNPASAVEERLYRCFTHPEPFARALVVGLSGSSPTALSSCERAAREAWSTHVPHVGQGLEYYYGPLLAHLPRLRYALLEADEGLGAGLACLRHRLFASPWREQPRVHDAYPARSQAVTSETRAALRAAQPRGQSMAVLVAPQLVTTGSSGCI